MTQMPANTFTLPSRYQPITKSLIHGGFGHVQKVHDTFLDRDVLFKSMQDSSNNHQLLNEIKAFSKARSRHVVDIYDVIQDEHGNVVGIIIELLTGQDYSQFHNKNKSSNQDYLCVIFQIASALRDLHLAGVVHRDLKLDNFRDSGAGILKLFDFGISVVGPNYRTKENRGTLVYAAPELFVPGVEITQEMDIYAFGICAWALVTATFPKELHECPPQTSAHVPSINSVSPGWLPIEVVQLIDSCLSVSPVARPSAIQLCQELSRQLVRGRHRGLFVQNSTSLYELSQSKPQVRITIGTLGELKVNYDGLVFRITAVTGHVYVNNQTAVVNMLLHESCLITFGDVSLGSGRSWVTFFSSNPEVVL